MFDVQLVEYASDDEVNEIVNRLGILVETWGCREYDDPP